jgi:bifunctional pyridoxal-dependent enzyme with beta-cystathionase and maltose regulon repressor activities
VDKLFAKPKIADMKLMESCFSVGEYWRVKTFKYIRENHKIMRQEFKKRNINLVLYTLDCGLISVIDFKNYGWNHTEIKRRL